MRLLNWILAAALIGSAFMTIVSPWVIKALFTPPVSFGTNCEPAAAWSMSKLIYSQLVGLVAGPIVGFIAFKMAANKLDERKRAKLARQATTG